MDKQADGVGRGPARTASRDSLFLLTNFSTPEGAPLGKARVRNLSATGLMADCERAIPAGVKVVLELRGVGKIKGEVAWSREGRIGLSFDEPIDPQATRKPVAKSAGQGLPDYLRPISTQARR